MSGAAGPGPGDPGASAGTDSSAGTDVLVAFLIFFVVMQLGFGVLPPVSAEDSAAVVERGSLALLSGLLAVMAFAWWRGRAALRLHFDFKALALYLPFLVIWIPLAMVVYPYCLRQMGIDFAPQEALRYYAQPGGSWRFFAVLFCTCVAAPVGEELLFRGFLYRAFVRGSAPWLTVLLTAVLFGLIHGALFAVPVGVLGLFFGYLRLRTGGVGTSIVAHMLHNSWTVAVVAIHPDLVTMVYDK